MFIDRNMERTDPSLYSFTLISASVLIELVVDDGPDSEPNSERLILE